MLTQIQLLESRLKEIGFDVVAHENVLQIVGISGKKNDEFVGEDEDEKSLDLEGLSHVIQVVIEFDDPLSQGSKFIFQGCSLKVYFEDWELQEMAKIIKLNIAGILSENGIFYGMNYEIPKSHEEVLVP